MGRVAFGAKHLEHTGLHHPMIEIEYPEGKVEFVSDQGFEEPEDAKQAVLHAYLILTGKQSNQQYCPEGGLT